MNESLTHFLLHTPARRWFGSPLHRFRPAPDQPIPWSLVAAHAVYLGAILGLTLGILARLAAGRWYSAPFLLPAAYACLVGCLWATLVRVAWNRRAQTLRSLAAAGQTPPQPAPLRGLRRLLPPLYLLGFLITALALCVSLENLRGSLALRSFHNELRARGEPTTVPEVIPPPIPDDQNLAMAPLLKSLFVSKSAASEIPPADSQAGKTLKSLRAEDPRSSFRAFAAERGRKQRSFSDGYPTDLAMWQAYYQSLDHWPQLPASAAATPAQSVLHALSRYDPELQQLRAAVAERPQARFPLDYDSLLAMELPHLPVFKSTAVALALHASALLAEGRSDEAISDLTTLTRLSEALHPEPVLVSHLVRFAIQRYVLQVAWEGCLEHRWSAEELRTLSATLATQTPIPDIQFALRGERVFVSDFFHRIARGRLSPLFFGETVSSDLAAVLRFIPRGWIRLNEVAHGRYILALTDAATAAPSHREFPPKGSLLTHYIDPKSPMALLASLVAPALDPTFARAYEQEAWRRLALVGLALEAHRLSEQGYPETLAALQPRFLDPLPVDVMDGQPLRYARTETGDYHLYSVGLDHQDDSGKRSEKRARSSADPKRPSDLVWR